VRTFKIDRLAQQEFDEAAAWYEHQEIGLGFEFIVSKSNPGAPNLTDS
jgi:hypothetical protein